MDSCTKKHRVSVAGPWVFLIIGASICGVNIHQWQLFSVTQAELYEHIRNDNDVDDTRVIADQNGRITEWQPGMRRLFGYAADEVVGRSIDMLMDVEDQGPHDLAFNRAMATPKPPETTHYIRCQGKHRDGTKFPLLIRTRVKATDDGVRFAVADFDPVSTVVEVKNH